MKKMRNVKTSSGSKAFRRAAVLLAAAVLVSVLSVFAFTVSAAPAPDWLTVKADGSYSKVGDVSRYTISVDADMASFAFVPSFDEDVFALEAAKITAPDVFIKDFTFGDETHPANGVAAWDNEEYPDGYPANGQIGWFELKLISEITEATEVGIRFTFETPDHEKTTCDVTALQIEAPADNEPEEQDTEDVTVPVLPDQPDEDEEAEDISAPVPQALPFTDVAEGAYYYDAVKWAYENGITSGLTATEFAPNGTCTRAQTVTFLWRASGSPEVSGITNPFVDVAADAYYYKAVLWAVSEKITTGVDATHFAPDASVTREQTVTFMFRAAGSFKAAAEAAFEDVTADRYSYDAICWAVANGITNGMDATHFSPDGDCLRMHIVTFIYRFVNLAPAENGETEPDVPAEPAEKEEKPENAIIAEIGGEYEDSFSQRAVLAVLENNGETLCLVHWANSADSADEWRMTVDEIEDGKVLYSSCEHYTLTADETGDLVSTDPVEEGAGYFEIDGAALKWTGAADESCRDCVFKPVSA